MIGRHQCSAVSPLTGRQCTMSNGHFGPHLVGGPYSVTERFVTLCAGDIQHDYHEHLNGSTECIYCGDIKAKPEDQTLVTKGAAHEAVSGDLPGTDRAHGLSI